MKLRRSEKRNVFFFLIVPLVIFSTLMLSYYLFFLLPKRTQILSLNHAEEVLQERKLLLTENRNLITQYLGLDPTVPTFPGDRENLMAKYSDSINKMTGIFSSGEGIKTLFFSSPEIKTHLRKCDEKNIQLSERITGMLQIQRYLEEEYKRIGNSAGKIYGYDPKTEFSLYTFPESREDVLEAVAVIGAGIGKVGQDVGGLGLESTEYKTFEEQLQVVLTELEQIGVFVKENAENKMILSQIEKFADSYRELKIDAFNLERKVFRSDEMLSVLADESNIINQYSELISETSNIRRKLAGR